MNKKYLRKLTVLVSIFFLGLLSSCLEPTVTHKYIRIDGDYDEENFRNNHIDYLDYSGGNFSIAVKNDSNRNVVCFKGYPSDSTLISGARGGQLTRLRYDENLFRSSGDFVLWVFTEDDYLNKRYNYYELRKTPYALIYAYYNKDSDSNYNMVYVIPSNLGGNYFLVLNNPTNYNFELRQNNLYGEPLVFAGANIVETKIFLGWDDYYIYPVIRKYNKRIGEIITSFPVLVYSDSPIYFQYSMSDFGNKSVEFNPMEWFNPADFNNCSTPGAAYVAVTNGNRTSGIALYKGATAEASITSTGGKYINTGKSLIFEVPMVNSNGKSFASTALISGWKIGNPVSSYYIPELTVEAGKLYFLDVIGDDPYDFTAQWRTYTDGELVYEIVDFDND